MSALMEQGVRQVDAGLKCMTEAAGETGVPPQTVRELAAELRATADSLEQAAANAEGGG